jgi:glycosyltransferase involved in cell wall biosynthesis
MKVLMLSWEYPPHLVGGLGKHVLELAPRLIEAGVEVHLVVPRLSGGESSEPLCLPDGSPATNGSQVYRVATSAMAGDFLTNTWHENILIGDFCSRLARQHGDFDLIHNHDWLTGFAATAVKHDFHLPLVATIHATEIGRNRGGLYNETQRAIHQAEWWVTYEAWRIIACSKYMAWEVATYFGVPYGKIDVIPNGVDPRPVDELRGSDLSEFRLSVAGPDEPIIYYVGRIVPEKGLWCLIDAVPLVVQEWPGVKFVLAGGGGYAEELKRHAQELGVEGNVFLPGHVSDDVRDKLFTVADCAVFPSLYEPFGMVALEAMAARVPVVVSDVGGLSEVVDMHETGIKVQPGNADSLAWGILYTLRNPQWSAQRVQNAERVAREQYNWRRVAELTRNTYARVVAEAIADDWAYNSR